MTPGLTSPLQVTPKVTHNFTNPTYDTKALQITQTCHLGLSGPSQVTPWPQGFLTDYNLGLTNPSQMTPGHQQTHTDDTLSPPVPHR